jgi:hypothetical protein
LKEEEGVPIMLKARPGIFILPPSHHLSPPLPPSSTIIPPPPPQSSAAIGSGQSLPGGGGGGGGGAGGNDHQQQQQQRGIDYVDDYDDEERRDEAFLQGELSGLNWRSGNLGQHLTLRQASYLVRSYGAFQRIYSDEICLKRYAQSTRVAIVGPR